MTRHKGFTLIELLVVIAIIALLMSILMPALSRVKKQAQSVACMSKLRSWGLQYKLYTDDNNGYFNEGWGYDHHTQNAGRPNTYGLWMNALRPYYIDDEMRFCPTATRIVMDNPSDSGTFKAWRTPGTMANRYPAADEGPDINWTGSYGTSNWTDYMLKDRSGGRLASWFWKCTQNLINPNQVPVIGDNTWHDAWPQHTDTPVQTSWDFGWGDKGTAGEMNQFCIDRHNGWTNLAFADWSVRHVGLKELWTLRWHREYNVNGPWTKRGGVQPSDWPQWLRKYKDY
jgi:prepilin-type N-terminal cleavage/methylation domain-containing protein/prepilin-type processing-associated H-X9-DG protein